MALPCVWGQLIPMCTEQWPAGGEGGWSRLFYKQYVSSHRNSGEAHGVQFILSGIRWLCKHTEICSFETLLVGPRNQHSKFSSIRMKTNHKIMATAAVSLHEAMAPTTSWSDFSNWGITKQNTEKGKGHGHFTPVVAALHWRKDLVVWHEDTWASSWVRINYTV